MDERAVGAITGAIVTIAGGLDFEKFYCTLMGASGLEAIARGLWGRGNGQ